MTAWYVGNLATVGTNSGSLANPWKGWVSVTWASLAAGDTLNVIGTVEVANNAPMGSHGGVEGNEVTIQSYGAGGTLAVVGNGNIYVNRSNTIMYGITITGTVLIESATASYPATLGYNIQLINCIVNIGGVYIQGYNADYSYGKLKFINNTIQNCTNGIQLLCTSISGAKTIQVNGFTATGNTIDNITNSAIELRFSSSASVTGTSYINDVVITGNTLSNLGSGGSGGQFIRLIASPSDSIVPTSDRVNVSNNTMHDDGLVGGINAIGGVAIFGYGKTATTFENKFQFNTVYNSYGAYGGCNVLVSNYVDISYNSISNIATGTVDGNGVLVDLYDSHIRVHHNTMSNINGKAGVVNSGCGVMILGYSEYIEVYNNTVTRCLKGLYNGGVTSSKVLVKDNDFLECTVYGIKHGSTAYPVVINNRFTGYGESSTSVTSIQVNTNLVHGYNSFENFVNGMVNQTLNGTESTTQINRFIGNIS